MFCDRGLQPSVVRSIAQLRDEPDWALLFILLELSVDKSLNALEPISSRIVLATFGIRIMANLPDRKDDQSRVSIYNRLVCVTSHNTYYVKSDLNPEVWREEAAKQFPDLLGKLTDADSPGMFWIDLHFEFEHAYDSERLDRIAAIYGYAKCCCEQPKGNTAADDLETIVATHFLEHIPENPRALADMPNWWTIEDVRLMRRRVCAGLGTVRSQVAAKPPFVTVAWGRLQTSTARVIDLRYRQHISPPIRLT